MPTSTPTDGGRKLQFPAFSPTLETTRQLGGRKTPSSSSLALQPGVLELLVLTEGKVFFFFLFFFKKPLGLFSLSFTLPE